VGTILKDLKDELKDLRSHLKYIQDVTTAIPTSNVLYKYVNSTTKKKFNYKSLVISLYGVIEHYSEKLLLMYLEEISKRITNYGDLKSKIKESNLFNSAHLTLKVIENKHHKYSSLNANTIIKNLSSCLNDEKPYFINYPSFTIPSGNLKHSKICDLFKQVDINVEQLFDKLTDFKNIKSENKYQKIDEIVERRNEIAHGSLNNLLDSSEFPDYIDFIEKYFFALHKVLKYDIEQEELSFKVRTKSIELENVKIFKGNIIGFVNNKKIWFRPQNKIIVEKNNGELYKCKILSINFFKSINSVTLKLNPKTQLKDNQKFYLVRK
jgi:translation initiation factor IF-1